MYCVCQHDLGMVQLHRDLTDFRSGRYICDGGVAMSSTTVRMQDGCAAPPLLAVVVGLLWQREGAWWFCRPCRWWLAVAGCERAWSPSFVIAVVKTSLVSSR